MAHSKNILFISYIFPPRRSGGTQRIQRFYHVLRRAGFDVYVITAKLYGNDIDRKEKNIFRIYDVMEFIRSRRRISRDASFETNGLSNWVNKIRSVVFLLFFVPDEYIFFIPLALIRGFRIMLFKKIDYIYTTFPPATNLIIAFLLALFFHKKMIVDMREPWLNKPDWIMRFVDDGLKKRRISLENRIERIILRRANIIIVNHRWMVSAYTPLVSKGSKLVVIPNGFDSQLIEEINRFSQKKRDHDLRFIYAGSYYLQHQPDYVFRAIRQAIFYEKSLKGRVLFEIYGEIDSTTCQLIRKYSTVFNIKTYSYIEKKELFKRIRVADIAVVSFPPIPWSLGMIPGKIYELKKLGVPLLIVGEKNSALEALSKEFGEEFFYAKDIRNIAEHILKISRNPRSWRLHSHGHAIDQYAYSLLEQKFLNQFS